MTRKCTRAGEAASALTEHFRGSKSGLSAAVAAVRVAAGRLWGFPGGVWPDAGSGLVVGVKEEAVWAWALTPRGWTLRL